MTAEFLIPFRIVIPYLFPYFEIRCEGFRKLEYKWMYPEYPSTLILHFQGFTIDRALFLFAG